MPEPLLQPRPTVVFREVPQGAVLFCTTSEIYFSLNPVGVEVWRLLAANRATEAELVQELMRGHPDVSEAVIAADVRALIAQLVEHELVEVPPAP